MCIEEIVELITDALCKLRRETVDKNHTFVLLLYCLTARCRQRAALQRQLASPTFLTLIENQFTLKPPSSLIYTCFLKVDFVESKSASSCELWSFTDEPRDDGHGRYAWLWLRFVYAGGDVSPVLFDYIGSREFYNTFPFSFQLINSRHKQ